MANAAKFLFDTDFRQPVSKKDPKLEAAAADAEARGYMRGLAEGRRHSEAEAEILAAQAQARLAGAMEDIAQAAGALLGELDRHRAETEALALELATALARRIAGDALSRDPMAAIAEAAAQSFQHLRGVPHLAVRLNDALVEPADELLRRMARERGFDGRVVVLGDPEIAPGDVRLEWADGGVVRDRSRIEEAVARTLGRIS
jgi:flagellar assembly protein FliH